MSDDKSRPDSQKSRQELLDEIYLLRDVAGERGARLAERDRETTSLRTNLDLILHSRSWRFTAPLRIVMRWLGKGSHEVGSAMVSNPPARSSWKDKFRRGEGESRPRRRTPPATQDCEINEPRLFVDITELALREGRTGVQRVTREILRVLLTSPPRGYVVEPVVARVNQPYRLTLARHSREGGNPGPWCFDNSSSGQLMNPQPGDIFLGLDHAMHAVVEHADEFMAWSKQGVRLWFVCNDTLPLSRPDWFPPEVHDLFKTWFETIARVGEGIACISQTTEMDVRRWLDTLHLQREPSLALGHFHLGSDIAVGTSNPDGNLEIPLPPRHSREGEEPVSLHPGSVKSQDPRVRSDDDSHLMFPTVTREQQAALDRFLDLPSFLMVGTLEPRKGHAQALAAFEQLWAKGDDVVLVIAGLPGWMTEVTQRRIRHHEEFGKRLFWFMDADDALLEKFYTTCTALLAPSEGEGFGLPLVEAARHGLPILCRDLPVFHKIAGEHATYFSGLDGDSLATGIRGWLDAQQHGSVPASDRIRWTTWAESARQLADVVVRDHFNTTVAGG